MTGESNGTERSFMMSGLKRNDGLKESQTEAFCARPLERTSAHSLREPAMCEMLTLEFDSMAQKAIHWRTSAKGEHWDKSFRAAMATA